MIGPGVWRLAAVVALVAAFNVSSKFLLQIVIAVKLIGISLILSVAQ